MMFAMDATAETIIHCKLLSLCILSRLLSLDDGRRQMHSPHDPAPTAGRSAANRVQAVLQDWITLQVHKLGISKLIYSLVGPWSQGIRITVSPRLRFVCIAVGRQHSWRAPTCA